MANKTKFEVCHCAVHKPKEKAAADCKLVVSRESMYYDTSYWHKKSRRTDK